MEAIVMEFENTIASDPEIMMGKPVMAGTRVTVELILDKIAHGESRSSGFVVAKAQGCGARSRPPQWK
jgi:uncharacterized protein (DUF433 family)